MLRKVGASRKLWARRIVGPVTGTEYVIEYTGTMVDEQDAAEMVEGEYMAYCPMTKGLRPQKNMVFYLDK